MGSDGKHNVFEIPEAKNNKPGYLSIFISVLSLLLLLPWAFTSKFLSFANSYIDFISDKLARSTL